MKYCCKSFKAEVEYGQFRYKRKEKEWDIRAWDREYCEWEDLIGDIGYCPFCGKELK